MGSRVCIRKLNPSVLTPHGLSFISVEYRPHACSHTSIKKNLGPVSRLDCGDGQTQSVPALQYGTIVHSWSRAGCTMACMGWIAGEIVIEKSIQPLPTPYPLDDVFTLGSSVCIWKLNPDLAQHILSLILAAYPPHACSHASSRKILGPVARLDAASMQVRELWHSWHNRFLGCSNLFFLQVEQ